MAVPEPFKTPYLHVRETGGALFPFAVEIVGNAKALLRLRKQIDRALEGIDTFPFDETLYRELDGDEFELVVKKAKSREEMRNPVQKSRETSERPPLGGDSSAAGGGAQGEGELGVGQARRTAFGLLSCFATTTVRLPTYFVMLCLCCCWRKR